MDINNYLVDTFSDCFFILVNKKYPDTLTSHHNGLNNILENSFIGSDTILIIIDVSVKNKVATLISHIYRDQEIIAKTVHHTMNVKPTEVKLFAIKCRINHTVQL